MSPRRLNPEEPGIPSEGNNGRRGINPPRNSCRIPKIRSATSNTKVSRPVENCSICKHIDPRASVYVSASSLSWDPDCVISCPIGMAKTWEGHMDRPVPGLWNWRNDYGAES